MSDGPVFGYDDEGECEPLGPTGVVAKWNVEHPIGTRVKYYPVRGAPGFLDTVTRSLAWVLAPDEPVVKVNFRAGGVALSHLEVVV